MHDCPLLRNFAVMTPSSARSKSASSNTIAGACPPSSRDSFVTFRAAPTINFFPTSVDPVNVIFRQIGLLKNSSPIIDADPTTTANTPFGSFAASQHSANARLHSGVWLAGFKIVGHPAASAGATFRTLSTSGKFHGEIAPTTPTGVLITR